MCVCVCVCSYFRFFSVCAKSTLAFTLALESIFIYLFSANIFGLQLTVNPCEYRQANVYNVRLNCVDIYYGANFSTDSELILSRFRAHCSMQTLFNSDNQVQYTLLSVYNDHPLNTIYRPHISLVTFQIYIFSKKFLTGIDIDTQEIHQFVSLNNKEIMLS